MPKRGWIAGYAVAFIIFGAGLFKWNLANAYIPATPESGTINHYFFPDSETVQPLSRYTRLLNGELFFEKIPEPVKAATVKIFHSNLKIYGIIRGLNPRAVVGLNGNDGQTWVVKPGAVVGGEKIVRIGINFVKVRNESGEGKVRLSE